jgi:hypothetical protein
MKLLNKEGGKMKYSFSYDGFLEICVPVLHDAIENFTKEERENLYMEAKEKTSSKIPAKILELDEKYMDLYEKLGKEPEKFFEITDELNRISERISALNVWFLEIEGYFIQSHRHF